MTHRPLRLALATAALLLAALLPSAPLARAAPMDGVPDPRVVDAICRSDFGGGLAFVTVYRDHGEVRALELRPDLGRFSHPPVTIYDPRGTVRVVLPEHPVERGSPEAERARQAREAALAGAVAAETIGCQPVARPLRELATARAGRYLVEGVVARAYRCPPCPPDAVCKPCLPDQVILSGSGREPVGPLAADELRVYTHGHELQQGERVRLRVAITLVPRGQDLLPDAELLGVEPTP